MRAEPDSAPRPGVSGIVAPRPPRRGLVSAIFSHATVALNRALDRTPGCRALYRRSLRATDFSDIEIHTRAAASGLTGLRIAFLCDIHAGSFMGERELCSVFDRVAELEPDVVCLGGDLVNSKPGEMDLMRRPIELVKPPLGTFAVFGNHDLRWGGDRARMRAALEDVGVEWLVNRGVRLSYRETSLWLCGIDDLTEGEPDLGGALEGRRDGETAVLLAHEPDHFLESSRCDVDLTLSGHTHGGQIRIGSWVPISHTTAGFHSGGYDADGCRLYVSRGVGATVLPIRLGARPEVPILRFV